MKTKVWTLIVMAFFVATAAMATELPKMNVIQVEENKAMLAYSFANKAPLEVTLTNVDGEILYHKQTEHKAEFKTLFNFEELGEGDFCVSVNYGNQSMNRIVCVRDNKILVSDATHCYEPYFRVDDKKVNVSFLNTSNKPVYVNIYQDGEHIDGSNLGREMSIQTTLDFGDLKRGTYEVVLTDNIKDHKFTVNL